MTTADVPSTPLIIEHRLRQAWRRECAHVHLRGAGHLLLALLGLLLVDLLLDWLLVLPGFARLSLLAVNLGVLGWVGYHYWWCHLRPFDSSRVALQVERLHPDLKSLLISYVQLNGQISGPVHGSPRLIRAVKQQAQEAVAPLDFRGIVDFSTLRNLGLVTGGALLAFLISAIFAGEYYRVLLVRLFNPSSRLAYPTRTRIEAITGDLVVRWGDGAQLEAQAGGEVPEQGFLYLKQADTRWERLPVSRTAKAHFSHSLARPSQDFDYYYRLGDVRSETHHVTVVPPPRMVETRVTLRYPDYVKRADDEYNSLNLPPIPEGTSITWELRCDQELAAGEVHFLREGMEPVPLVIGDDPQIVRLSLTDVAVLPGQRPLIRSRKEAETLSYQFRWTERVHGFSYRDPTRYTLEVVPDRAPVVNILRPRLYSEQDKMLATTKKTLALTFEVSDDHGLARAWLAYRVNDDTEPRRRPLGSFPEGTRSDTFRTAWSVAESIPDLKEGDVLTCAVEASDNREGRDGPNVGRSNTLRLHIVSEEEFRRYADKEKERGFDRTRAAVREETESSKRIKTLIPDEEDRP